MNDEPIPAAGAEPREEPTTEPASDPPIEAPPADAERIERAGELARSLRDQIRRAVVGQDRVIEQILWAWLAGGHVLVEGVPGLGKTLLALALARSFRGNFARVQFTPDLMPSDVTGHVIYDEKAGAFRVRKGPAFTNLLLADEINRAPAKTQAALLEVMQERQVTIEGEAHPLDPPFMAIATQNPIEQEGTYPLPEAQLDRFLVQVRVGYPSEEDEVRLVSQVTRGATGDSLDVSAVEAIASPADAVAAQHAAASVLVVEEVAAYAVAVARATRSWRGVTYGAGPRGAISMIRVARARALLEGRTYVVPDDVKRAALPALRHRIALAPELELEGRSTDDVLELVLAKVEVPRS